MVTDTGATTGHISHMFSQQKEKVASTPHGKDLLTKQHAPVLRPQINLLYQVFPQQLHHREILSRGMIYKTHSCFMA